MTYLRVIPRDLFNEAKLLKCLGALYIESERLPAGTIVLEHDHGAFVIEQNPDDGSIYVANVYLLINGRRTHVYTGLNARGPYPMYAEVGDETVSVFTDDGKLDPNFIKAVRS
jgi:hypothetical protein